MGLFGLGLPEVAVVAGIAVLVFGELLLPQPWNRIGFETILFFLSYKEISPQSQDDGDKDGWIVCLCYLCVIEVAIKPLACSMI